MIFPKPPAASPLPKTGETSVLSRGLIPGGGTGVPVGPVLSPLQPTDIRVRERQQGWWSTSSAAPATTGPLQTGTVRATQHMPHVPSRARPAEACEAGTLGVLPSRPGVHTSLRAEQRVEFRSIPLSGSYETLWAAPMLCLRLPHSCQTSSPFPAELSPGPGPASSTEPLLLCW